jgi:hypothetical protein
VTSASLSQRVESRHRHFDRFLVLYLTTCGVMQEKTRAFLQKKSILVITFYKEQAAPLATDIPTL